MSLDAAESEEVPATTGVRHSLELAGLALVSALAAAMLGFVVVDWLQTIGGPFGAAGTSVFDAYTAAGGGFDALLGTRNLFELPSTLRVVATGVLVGVVGPLVGAFLVHRQMALIGETLAHTAFAGVAVGIVAAGLTGMAATGDRLILVAFVVSVVAALGVQQLTERTDSYGDVPIAIVLAGSFAVGTLLISAFREQVPIGIDIEDFLFGQVAVVTIDGMRLVAVLTVVVTGLVLVSYKQFLFITFDEQAARAARMNVDRYNSLLIVMTAVVVVGAMQILGVILVAGLLVIPPAAASQVARDFRETLYLSVLLGQFAVVSGLVFAIVAGLPAGGSIIVVAILLYGLAILTSDRSHEALSAD